MSKLNITDWRVIVKVIIAVATALLGAIGAQEVTGED